MSSVWRGGRRGMAGPGIDSQPGKVYSSESIPWFLKRGKVYKYELWTGMFCLPPPPHPQTFHFPPYLPPLSLLRFPGSWWDKTDSLILITGKDFGGGVHIAAIEIVSTLWLLFVKGHGNEADFLGFLQKLVPHESLTLPFGPPTLRIVDTGSRRLPVSLSRGVDDSAYRWYGESLSEEKN